MRETDTRTISLRLADNSNASWRLNFCLIQSIKTSAISSSFFCTAHELLLNNVLQCQHSLNYNVFTFKFKKLIIATFSSDLIDDIMLRLKSLLKEWRAEDTYSKWSILEAAHLVLLTKQADHNVSKLRHIIIISDAK